MAEDQTSLAYKRCVGCLENMLAEALICPKCGTHQKPQRWATIFLVLKWVGGLTAIISLVIGINQLSGIVKEYNERDESIHQLVSASKLLINMKDYQAAWGVIQKAVTISSSSQAAFNQQVDVAMAWLRNIWMQKGKKKYSEIIDPFIFTLSQRPRSVPLGLVIRTQNVHPEFWPIALFEQSEHCFC